MGATSAGSIAGDTSGSGSPSRPASRVIALGAMQLMLMSASPRPTVMLLAMPNIDALAIA